MTAYRKPPVFVVRVFNPVVSFLVRWLGPESKRGLEVRRRKGGAWRGVPVDESAVRDCITSPPRLVRRRG
jgi:hypothetical protein